MTALISLIGLAIVGLIVAATRGVMRRREEMRRIAQEAEATNVMTDDTRRAMWISGADHDSGDSSSGGDGGGGD